jgi:hypothetical protein
MVNKINTMFEKYPKKRSKLPEEYREIYSIQFKENREGATKVTSISQKMETWLHKKVAADLKGKLNRSTLEIGAGTLNQLHYENTRPYDIIEPFTELFFNSPLKEKIDTIYKDISEIDSTKKYERIISIATFEHITNLPEVVAQTCILLNKNGTLRVSIPNEGTLLWKLGWKLTTGVEFKIRYGLDYETLMRYEHVNSAQEIDEVIRYFYENVKCSYFGLNRSLAFYRYYECSEPILERAGNYLKK